MKSILKITAGILLAGVIAIVAIALLISAGASSVQHQAAKAHPYTAHASKSKLTAGQTNAIAAAQQYLSMEGFSKAGLIGQLDSPEGDGYSVADATFAVDHLKVNWNTEAVKSAKDYLSSQPFSCSGLIGQLDASAGDQYTHAQATYGAHKAGACS